MSVEMKQEYWAPEHVREYLRLLGFALPIEPMEGYIRSWHNWMEASRSFYNYRDTDGFGRIYEVHRRSIHSAMRVCCEWGSLLLNDKTAVVCDDQACADYLSTFFTSSNFMPMAQATLVRAFGKKLPDEGQIRTIFDDSIITAWEYRQKWYGKEKKVAKALARGLSKGKAGKEQDA